MLGLVDAWYYRRYRLRTLGPVLFLGQARYRGPELRFEDGTLLRDNDPIGRLHFNNASIAALGEGSLQRVGFRFAKLMRQSLRTLAEVAQSDPSLRDVSVFQGMTWLPAHGEVVGFVSTPMPKNWRTRLLAGHFRLLDECVRAGCAYSRARQRRAAALLAHAHGARAQLEQAQGERAHQRTSMSEQVYLTFDDGPDPRWTPQILDLLAQARMHATFFAIGECAQREPALMRCHCSGRPCCRQSHVQPSPSVADETARRPSTGARRRAGIERCARSRACSFIVRRTAARARA